MNPRLASILERHDAKETVAAIARAESLSPGYVYGILREHRPERKRAKRTRTSEKPAQIRYLASQGIAAVRIAVLLSVSKAYVYKSLEESTT